MPSKFLLNSSKEVGGHEGPGRGTTGHSGGSLTGRRPEFYVKVAGKEALSAPLYQKHERGAQLCVSLEDFLEKLY